MRSLYQHHPESCPYHVSVGAVLFNEKYEVCVNHFYANQVPENIGYLTGGLSEGYILMRETLENNETLVAAVLRGLQEEFGATGVVEKYLGALMVTVKTPKHDFEKVTLYHAVRLATIGKPTGTDEESEFAVEWYEPRQLLSMFKQQAKLTPRAELNEAPIIERLITSYQL